jgi:hypothetical protein
VHKLNEFLIVSLFFVIYLVTSCNPTKEVATGNKPLNTESEISIPFSDSEYKTDQYFFRAVQSGTNEKIDIAKNIALQNAKVLLASNIQSTILSVSENYSKEYNKENKQIFESKFEEISIQITRQVISNVEIIGEKVIREDNKLYLYWVAIEMEKMYVLKGLEEIMADDDEIDINYTQFEEIFNNEN